MEPSELAAMRDALLDNGCPQDVAEKLAAQFYKMMMDYADSQAEMQRDAAKGWMVAALRHLNHATPKQRNGPVYKAADTLRDYIGLPPMVIGGNTIDGLD